MSSIATSAVSLTISPTQAQALRTSTTPVAFLDATWFMPNVPRSASTEFATRRLPGAQFLDLDAVASPHDLGLKHMMPDRVHFANACCILGISPATHVILYDTQGIFSAPRALFMFRTFGHARSSVIDGGLPRWENEGREIETSPPVAAQKAAYPVPEEVAIDDAIRSYQQIVANSLIDPATQQAELVLDARPRGRYIGTDPEPRPGLSSGHIPNSISLPFNVFLRTVVATNGMKYTLFLPVDELRRALDGAVGERVADSIVRGQIRVVTSCGSGMTAGVIWLGLKLLGVKQVRLYDESWTGYAMRPTSVIVM